LTWTPTTGEFGPANGFGDFENHDRFATLFSAHYTRSTETPQSQPNTESIENTQLRLSDGTLLFAVDAFNTPGRITEARYQMMALDAAAKYRGYALEFEYYSRWLDHFTIDGIVPVTDLHDTGFQLQASAMLIPKSLMLYASGSKIFGEYGDPYDIAVGFNYFPFKRRDMRINVMGLYTTLAGRLHGLSRAGRRQRLHLRHGFLARLLGRRQCLADRSPPWASRWPSSPAPPGARPPPRRQREAASSATATST
jgi:hypothetical protein